jgi:F420-0:gamma-glutamyl ligase-like protein
MTRYSALAVATSYWKPQDDYLAHIVAALGGRLRDGDFVVVSEKALAVASGQIVDEVGVVPSGAARFLAGFWMRNIWGYPLGLLCGFGPRLRARLQGYPSVSGARHKQLVLERGGLLQALLFGSEGGVDGSNLAFSFVSLPLVDADVLAENIQGEIQRRLGKRVCVIIADTDKTYKFYNFYFTPRPKPLRGIHSFGGVVTYVLGRMLALKRSSTPLAVSDCSLSAGEALKVTNIADRARGAGSGATVWDMAARFGVGVDEVSWDMLAGVVHKPLVIVRPLH